MPELKVQILTFKTSQHFWNTLLDILYIFRGAGSRGGRFGQESSYNNAPVTRLSSRSQLQFLTMFALNLLQLASQPSSEIKT